MFTRNFTIILVILFILLILLIMLWMRFKNKNVQYKGRGYCSIDADYVEPVVYENFISDKECDYILKTANPMFSQSRLVSGFMTDVRKSETAWLPKSDPVVANIIKRVCNITNIPFENSEKMQVVKYEPNGYYRPHYDASCDDKKECVEFEKNGGQRVLTMIIYLNEDFTGGRTEFGNLGREYIPKKNNGLLFYSLQKDGNKCHPKSLHAGMPVETGNKYIANVWLRERNYND